MKAGIQTRLLLLTTVVLGTFLSLAGFVLDRSFKASVLTNVEEQLRIVVYSLMGTVQDDGVALSFAAPLPEPRLGQPESGLYAAVLARHERVPWRSPSALTTGVEMPMGAELDGGERNFLELDGPTPRFVLNYAVIWGDSEDEVLTFTVGTDQQPFLAQLQGFRRNLYIGLGAVTVFFVLAQYLAVRWGLRPLRTMATEVRALEEGRRESLSDDYPSELEGLKSNLDRFVAHEQRSRTRYRRAMEDLAHSLKTPLAVIRNAFADDGADGARELLREQLTRMESTVTHQLSRAAVSGPLVVSKAVNVHELVGRLLRALDKAYGDRGIEAANEVPPSLALRVDERDLMEMLGNLLENAYKYTRSRIEIGAQVHDSVTTLLIDDDGPGIAPALRSEVLNRGTRADELQPGQGIGLAMVQELVEAYDGSLAIDDSPLGGARLKVGFDAHAPMKSEQQEKRLRRS